MCCTCSVSLHTVQFCVCLRLCVCLPACVSVSTCKVSTFLLSFVCLCVCLLVCVCMCGQRPAPLWVIVGRVGQSTGLSQTSLFSSGPTKGFFVSDTQHERPASRCLLICWSLQATVFFFFLLVNEIDALINALINYSLERWNILRRWPVECDKWATDSELCPRQQNHCDIPVWKKYLQGCSAI